MSTSMINLIKGEMDKYRQEWYRNPELITLPAGSAVPLITEAAEYTHSVETDLNELLIKGEVACAEHINKGMKCFGILIKVEIDRD